LQREIAAAARSPDLAARVDELGADPGGNSSAEFRDMVHAQVASLRPVVRALRLQPE
jgi:tripartite-type tricarboxylate transporter receptor subunit TctC